MNNRFKIALNYIQKEGFYIDAGTLAACKLSLNYINNNLYFI